MLTLAAGVLAFVDVGVALDDGAAGLALAPLLVSDRNRSSLCCCAFHLASSIARSAADLWLPICGANTFCERWRSDFGSTYFRISAAARAAAAEIWASVLPMALGTELIWRCGGGMCTLPGWTRGLKMFARAAAEARWMALRASVFSDGMRGVPVFRTPSMNWARPLAPFPSGKTALIILVSPPFFSSFNPCIALRNCSSASSFAFCSSFIILR